MDNPFGIEPCPHGNPGYCLGCEYGEVDSMISQELHCYQCKYGALEDAPLHKVVKLGPIIEQHRDPTQTYILACGHTVI